MISNRQIANRPQSLRSTELKWIEETRTSVIYFFKKIICLFSRGSQSYRSSVIPVSLQFLEAAYPKVLKAILRFYLLLNNALL